MSSRGLQKVNPVYSLDKQAAILLDAKREMTERAEELKNGNKAHGFEVRVRGRLMREAGCDYSEAINLFRALKKS